jgi:hypothetical protein
MYYKPITGWTDSSLQQFGVWSINMSTSDRNFSTQTRYAPQDVDIEDALNEGVIIVAAAGNDGALTDAPGGKDYNNYFITNQVAYYYTRGTSPSGADNVINVGSISSQAGANYTGSGITEPKANYSNTGPRINIYSPGTQIVSAYISQGVADARNPNYKLYRINGTSMASPQVAGVLACMLEIYPHANYKDALDYIMKYCTINQIADVNSTSISTFFYSLRGGPNKYLKYNYDRKRTGILYPNNEYAQFRPITGSQVRYPKPKIRRGG